MSIRRTTKASGSLKTVGCLVVLAYLLGCGGGEGDTDITYPLDTTTSDPGDSIQYIGGDAGEDYEQDIVVEPDSAPAGTCEPAFVPSKLDYGVVPKGFYKEMAIKLLNNGTGYCSFVDAWIEECSGVGPSCACPEPGTGTQSECYELIAKPPAVAQGIGPGESESIKIRCTLPDTEGVLGGMCSALLSVELVDQLDQTVTIPAADPVSGCREPNLMGLSGVSESLVLPGDIDFGLVAIGCESQTFKVCVYNSGTALLTINDISLKDCSPEFEIKGLPGLPKDIPAAESLCFDTVYAPQNEGMDICQIQVESTDPDTPVVFAGLSGEGTWESHQVDKFIQVSGTALDLLFVVDDSGSMCGKTQALTEGFDAFVQQLDSQAVNYHVGVISMNVVDEAVRGHLNEGDSNQVPLFITPDTPDVPGTFAKLADLGCDGGPNCGGLGGGCTDEKEAGLFAMWYALTPPLVNGWNAGFMREDAQLAVVALSNEDDQGPFDAEFYSDFLTGLKGVWNSNMVHFNAIVGLENPACEEAYPGLRYVAVAEATGGTALDICTQDFQDLVNSIGNIGQSLKTQFFLTRLPAIGTLQVSVDGEPCPDGWTWDAASNAIVFDPDGPCWPGPGADVEVEYDVACMEC